ncbi:DUF4129 domain-containing protein [Paenibacillus sp.]|uniref:DUF4129 domain-containing protein n=1 Tax=Paenibacillus sp. TaxID=58172 RepID=UPI00281162A0|nr:DUF4129 domain-containing protein [Paenibacillus sp.]
MTPEKEELLDILSQREFTDYLKEAEEPGQNLLLYWLERLFDALGKLFPELEMAEGSGDALGYAIIGGGLVALAALSLFLFRLLWVERRALRRKAAASADEMETAPAGLLDRSRTAAANGAYREASRLLFLALLLGFQERGLLRVTDWKTNWEYAEELAGKGGAAALFRSSAVRFDAIWYGGRDIAPAEYDGWRREVEAAIADEGAAS